MRVSVKTDNSGTRKIQLFPTAENDGLFRVEIDRRRYNRDGQQESLFSRDDVLEIITEALGWGEAPMQCEPQQPMDLRHNTRVQIISRDEDNMPRRRSTWTVGRPFLDFRHVWRVWCVGEKNAVRLADITAVGL